jgi:lipopolysaccharide biosynthesis glycosyltransferase
MGCFVKISKLNIDDLTTKYEQLISPLIKHFSSDHTYYKDPLFFLSPFLHQILPEHISRVIMLDIDLRFDNDVQELYKLFEQFNQSQIMGNEPSNVLHRFNLDNYRYRS